MVGKRLEYVDALRGIAILGVIITHTASLVGVTGPFRKFTNLSGNGVLLFFVVSAFTIFSTFSRSSSREQAPVRNFFIKRVMRIAPIYWMGIVLYTVVYGLQSRGWRPGPELWHYPLHATFTNLLVPGVDSSVVPGGWSISCEMIFYVTVPLWFVLIRNLRSAAIFSAICVTILPIVVWGLSQATEPMFAGYSDRIMQDYWYRNFLSQLGCFSFGILLFFAIRAEMGKYFRSKKINLAATLFIIVSLGAMYLHPIIFKQQHWLAACCMALALMLSEHQWGAIVNRVTIFCGKVSYSAYILHFLVVYQVFLVVPASTHKLAQFAGVLTVGLAITLPSPTSASSTSKPL